MKTSSPIDRGKFALDLTLTIITYNLIHHCNGLELVYPCLKNHNKKNDSVRALLFPRPRKLNIYSFDDCLMIVFILLVYERKTPKCTVDKLIDNSVIILL